MIGLTLGSLVFGAASARSDDYVADFDNVAGPEWSHRQIDKTPIGERGFLGQFGNDSVVLQLESIGAGAVTVSFDLMLVNSWDGGSSTYGPDVWQLRVVNGPVLLRTTFSNLDEQDSAQSYPAAAGEGENPAYSGAAERDSLGYTYFGDAVYRLTFTFEPPARDFGIAFSAEGLQVQSDESWGLDNVVVGGATARAKPLLRLVREEGGGYVPIKGPWAYGRRFFVEVEYLAPPDDAEQMVSLGSSSLGTIQPVATSGAKQPGVSILRSTDNPAVFRSKALYLALPKN